MVSSGPFHNKKIDLHHKSCEGDLKKSIRFCPVINDGVETNFSLFRKVRSIPVQVENLFFLSLWKGPLTLSGKDGSYVSSSPSIFKRNRQKGREWKFRFQMSDRVPRRWKEKLWWWICTTLSLTYWDSVAKLFSPCTVWSQDLDRNFGEKCIFRTDCCRLSCYSQIPVQDFAHFLELKFSL